jgi:hypothetical protein
MVVNCIDGSRVRRCCLPKICRHGLPSKTALVPALAMNAYYHRFAIVFDRIFAAIPSYKPLNRLSLPVATRATSRPEKTARIVPP